MGRRLPLHSWGWRGQIDDLARMPSILRAARPWLRIDVERVYAVGGSMGGQETLLLVGQHPRLLAGAVAFDSVTDFKLRYDQFARIGKGRTLQALARIEVGGTPRTHSRAYVLRSPTNWINEVAESGVPLQVGWSDADEIVVDQGTQSQRFFEELTNLQPRGRVEKDDRLMEPHRGELCADPTARRCEVARSCRRRLSCRSSALGTTSDVVRRVPPMPRDIRRVNAQAKMGPVWGYRSSSRARSSRSLGEAVPAWRAT